MSESTMQEAWARCRHVALRYAHRIPTYRAGGFTFVWSGSWIDGWQVSCDGVTIEAGVGEPLRTPPSSVVATEESPPPT